MELNNTSSNIIPPCAGESEKLADLQTFAAIAYLFFGLVAVFGNLIVVIAMYRAKLLQYGGYLTLAHFSATDIATGLVDVFYSPWAILYQNDFHLAFWLASVITLSEFSRKCFNVFMAGTRMYSLMRPISARGRMTLHWYRKAIYVTWLICIVIVVPLWVGRSYYFDPCSYHWAFNESDWYWVSIYGLVINITVSLVILVAYPMCFVKICRNRQKWETSAYSTEGRRQSLNLQNSVQEKKILCLFFLNACIFLLYWMPIYLFQIWKVDIPNSGLFQEIMRCIEICYNPFAYICLNSSIRNAVKDLLFINPCRAFCKRFAFCQR